jgi:hypothetical protein
LATISAYWSDVDDFSTGPNKVDFDSDVGVRGRLGTRLATQLELDADTTLEPFVIGSLWTELAGDNEAYLLSLGRAFQFSDKHEETWGEASVGVNLYNRLGFAAFAKADLTFGSDIEGYGGQAGVRIATDLLSGRSPRRSPAEEPDEAGDNHGASDRASLEERIAELEATTARKGNRKVDLTLGGTISHAALFWDDEHESNVYIVGNDNDATSFELLGAAEKLNGTDWSAGFVVEIGILDNQSSEVNQLTDDVTTGLEVNEAHVWIKHERLGQISWGQIGGSATVDDATEMDLSEAKVPSFSGIEDIGGGFFLRRSGLDGAGGLTSITWGDLIDHLPGIDGNLIRYDTPEFNGVQGWAEWGEDDVWELVLTYNDPDPEDEKPDVQSRLFRDYLLAAAVSYHVIGSNEGPQNDESNSRTVSGSLSVLHEPSGFNLTLAGGVRHFTQTRVLNDGTERTPDDASFWYVKPGLLLDIHDAGKTAFYSEFGRFRDFLGHDTDTEGVAGLAGIDEGIVCARGEACLVSESEATIWGFGVAQHIDSAEMQLYLGFRHYRADIDLTTAEGAAAPEVPLNEFATVISGVLIEF